jgi:hypothetical protein
MLFFKTLGMNQEDEPEHLIQVHHYVILVYLIKKA